MRVTVVATLDLTTHRPPIPSLGITRSISWNELRPRALARDEISRQERDRTMKDEVDTMRAHGARAATRPRAEAILAA